MIFDGLLSKKMSSYEDISRIHFMWINFPQRPFIISPRRWRFYDIVASFLFFDIVFGLCFALKNSCNFFIPPRVASSERFQASNVQEFPHYECVQHICDCIVSPLILMLNAYFGH